MRAVKGKRGYALASALAVMLVLSVLCSVLLTGVAGDTVIAAGTGSRSRRRAELDEIGMYYLRFGRLPEDTDREPYTLTETGHTLTVWQDGELLLTVELDADGTPVRWENLG